MTERSHLSIGEVLNLLQDEFPDITISKIRFLESQGLLDPERTPSGYRKFYEEDIERLRWILRQQKDNFLPLKVIKDRLASGQLDDPPAALSAAAAPSPRAGARTNGRCAGGEGRSRRGRGGRGRNGRAGASSGRGPAITGASWSPLDASPDRADGNRTAARAEPHRGEPHA